MAAPISAHQTNGERGPGLRVLVPLAGLEPATCCLGDVSVQTLCRSAKLLVVSDRGAKVILWCWRLSSLGESRSPGRPPDQPPPALPPTKRIREFALTSDRAWGVV